MWVDLCTMRECLSCMCCLWHTQSSIVSQQLYALQIVSVDDVGCMLAGGAFNSLRPVHMCQPPCSGCVHMESHAHLVIVQLQDL